MERFTVMRRVQEDEIERKRAAKAKADELLKTHHGVATVGD